MKIFLVDDNKTFRSNLKLFLEGHLGHQVVGEASDGIEFLSKITTTTDIILMDINMPGMNGIDTTKQGTWVKHDLKIIAVSQYKENADLQHLIGAGFKGFVSKTNLFDQLESAINIVYKGGYHFPNEIEISTPSKK